MKSLVSTLLIVATALVSAGGNAAATSAAATVVKGDVLEFSNVDSYTYLRLKTKDGETWAAVSRFPVKQGEKVTIENVTVMDNFESRSLNKTFPKLVFGTVAGAGSAATGSGNTLAGAHAGNGRTPDTPDVQVPKATGANARTVAEIMTKSAELKDKPVLVRGKVVKYNAGIMGKNWIHLRDGTGSAAGNTNDILVTSMSGTKVGDIVTVKGIVRTDKDFGSGYVYKILIEEATFQQ